eukprot:5252475-Amphidinium_carterae.1
MHDNATAGEVRNEVSQEESVEDKENAGENATVEENSTLAPEEDTDSDKDRKLQTGGHNRYVWFLVALGGCEQKPPTTCPFKARKEIAVENATSGGSHDETLNAEAN